MRKLLLLLLLLTLGCAPKMIILDKHGNNFPNEINMISSVGGLKADFYFYRVYEVSEDSRYSDYYPLEKMVKLPQNTEEVYLNLHLWNPNRLKIKVRKIVTVDGEHQIHTVFRGDPLDKVFQFKGPLIPGAEVNLTAHVYVDGHLVIVAGRAKYKFPKKEVMPERGK